MCSSSGVWSLRLLHIAVVNYAYSVRPVTAWWHHCWRHLTIAPHAGAPLGPACLQAGDSGGGGGSDGGDSDGGGPEWAPASAGAGASEDDEEMSDASEDGMDLRRPAAAGGQRLCMLLCLTSC